MHSQHAPRRHTPKRALSPGVRLLPIAFAALLALHGLPAMAQPVPTQLPVLRPGSTPLNAQVGAATGGLNPSMAITQTQSASNRAVVEWQSFSIGRNATVNIAQPNAQSVLINRVTGSAAGRNPSEIFGAMNANGRVLLVNPSGVIFGAGAQVNVGAMVASTLDLTDAMSANNYQGVLGGGAICLQLNGAASSVQVNEAASIRAAEGGSVVLVGSQGVQQHGVIEAARGRVTLAAADTAEVLPLGSSGFVDLLVRQPSAQGRISTAGVTDVSSATGVGGNISLQANAIDVAGTLNADGALGGGRITVGGNTTREVMVRTGATLSADATDTGHGGVVDVLAMYQQPGTVARTDFGVAEVYGEIRARGGVNGGNGGQVETSGVALNTRLDSASGGIVARGQVDARARHNSGVNGTWTLDPYNVTITARASNAVEGTFTPTASGANVNASDISAALNAGTDVVITTGTTEVGTEGGTITLESGTVISRTAGTGTANLTLRAHSDIYLQSGASIEGTAAAPINVNLHSNIDGLNGGSVQVFGNIVTGGGHVDIGGGTTPTTGYASSGGQASAGVYIVDATIDTRGSSGRGNISIRGQSGQDSFSNGIAIYGGSLYGHNITLNGLAAGGTGVELNSASGQTRLDTASGLIDVRGVADATGLSTSQPIGVNLYNTDIDLHGAGSLTMAGRAVLESAGYGGSAGLHGTNTHIVADAGNRNTVTLAGELVASTSGGVGMAFFNNESGGLTINGGFDANGNGLPTGLNVVLGGQYANGRAIDLGTGFDFDILTTGMVNLRPLGVNASGALVEQPNTPIDIGGETAGHFYVNPVWLQLPGSTNFGMGASQGVVIGSSAHNARITLHANQLTNHDGVSLVFQNQGAGSQGAGSDGITLDEGNRLLNLALRTSGNVTQVDEASGITVLGQLVVEGGANSTITLDRSDNSIASLSFDPPASFNFFTNSALTIGGGTAAGYTPGTGFSPLTITSNLGGNTALIEANGDITINTSVGMASSTGQLNIVAPSSSTITLASGVSVTAPSGGVAKLWAGDVVQTGTVTTPGINLYGCAFAPGATMCDASGIAIPLTGAFQLRPNQPTLDITAAISATAGSIPTLSPTVSGVSVAGLVNGDSASISLGGVLATTATASSPAGTYAITAGSLTSPTGYAINFTPGVLTINGALTPPTMSRPSFIDSTRSGFLTDLQTDVYGRNLASPFICTAASLGLGGLGTERQTDPLASEWGKVRSQPQLSGCLNVTSGGQCSAF